MWEQGGNPAYPLGTDQVGRDILSRIIHGARISLLVGISAVAVSLVVGVLLGLLSGFIGGRVDTVIMTVVDITLSFPAAAARARFRRRARPEPGHDHRRARADRLGALRARRPRRGPGDAREGLHRGRPRDGRERAAHALRHVLPNTVSSIIVMSTLQVAQAILQEAALSFLGVGTASAYPTWGQMIALGRDFVSVAWWLATFPGLAILLTVLAINLVGDRLRDALDPRVR